MPRRCIDDDILVAHVDGELAPALAGQTEAAVMTDRTRQGRIAMFPQSRTARRAAFVGLELPASSSTRKRAANGVTPQSQPRALLPWALSIAAAVLGFVVGTIDIPGYFRGPAATYVGASVQAPRIERLLEDIVDDQVIFGREREPIIAPPAGSKDRIEAWLSSRLNLGIKVPDLTARGLEFRGSRLFAVQGQALFMLIYVDDKDERIGIGIGRYKSETPTALKSIEEDGVKASGRIQDGFLYLVVGPTLYPLTQSLADELPTLLLPRRADTAVAPAAVFGEADHAR